MTDPYLGEIRIVAFAFAPRGWALCQGQLLPIAQNAALFSLLGTFYGGNGQSTFALPNFQGVAALGVDPDDGTLARPGSTGGASTVTLTPSQLPAHSHTVNTVTSTGTTSNPANATFAVPRAGRLTEAAYGTGPAVPLAADAFGVAGGSLPHNNMQPFLTMNYIIALQGAFPQRS